MATQIPWSTANAVKFNYAGQEYTISKLRNNKYLGWVCDLKLPERVLYGVCLASGVNMLKQYSTSLPNLYCYNTQTLGTDIQNPDVDLLLIIKDD